MEFSFNASTFRALFHSAVASYLDDPVVVAPELSAVELDAGNPQNYVAAMDQVIELMARADADSLVKMQMSTESVGLLEKKDISQIGQYTLDILEAVVAYVHNKTGQQRRDLMHLSVPVALWVARHGGKLSQIDMPVNSLAGYANELTEPHQLEDLAGVIREIIDACNDEIRRDLEQTNMMRPWRVLNLNYGIVATRSHQPALIEQAYDALVQNLPQDARQFFREGKQQMDIIGYPDEVRDVVERYNTMWGAGNSLH